MKVYRNSKLEIRENDEGKNIYSLSFSSETKVPRFYGNEILSHKRGDVNLNRLNNGGAVLVDHYGDQVGVVRNARIEGKRGLAEIEFGNTEHAKAVEADVKEGIRQNVSVGYAVRNIEKVAENDGVGDYLVRSWEPFEISIVSVPADPSIGIGRSFENEEEAKEKNESFMTLVRAADDEYKRSNSDLSNDEKEPSENVNVETRSENQTQTHKKGTVTMSENINAVDPAELERLENEARGAEREKLQRFRAINKKAGGHFNELVLEQYERGASVEEFQSALIDAWNKRSDEVVSNAEKNTDVSLKLDKEEEKRFSVVNAIRGLINNERTFESEVSDQFRADNPGLPFLGGGILIPTSMAAQRDMTVGVPADGGLTVQTSKMPMIDMLKNMLVLNQTRMTRLTGLRDNLSFPRKITASTADFLAEIVAITDSNPTFDEVTMAPKRIGSDVRYSKQLFRQSNESIENVVRQDILQEVALQVDSAGLQGAGGVAPTGIVNTVGVNSVTFGGAATWPKVVEFETAVAVDNALDGQLAYVTTPAVRGAWKTIEKAATTGQYLWPEVGNEVNGYQALTSNQVAGDKVIFGNWQELMFGEWGAIELLVDPVTLASEGLVKIVANYYVDFALRHPVSFAVSSDAGNQ